MRAIPVQSYLAVNRVSEWPLQHLLLLTQRHATGGQLHKPGPRRANPVTEQQHDIRLLDECHVS